MSPEQAGGNSVDYRTDIYSLACLLHYMLTGHHAIQKKSNDYETICVILNNDFPRAKDLVPQLSDNIQETIFKAAHKDMRIRYQTAEEFKQALSGIQPTPPPGGGGKRTTLTDRISVTIGKSGCDIIVPSEFVSRSHLEIEYLGADDTLKIADTSTNGSIINGRYIHKESTTIPYRPTEILLAGRGDCRVDWATVADKIREKQQAQASSTRTTDSGTYVPDDTGGDIVLPELAVGYKIASFFFPIVGWICWYVWRKKRPDHARETSKWAWYGFATGMVLNMISHFL
jgi:serine/threonine-protein kinase